MATRWLVHKLTSLQSESNKKTKNRWARMKEKGEGRNVQGLKSLEDAETGRLLPMRERERAERLFAVAVLV